MAKNITKTTQIIAQMIIKKLPPRAIILFMVCLLVGLKNGNETYVYLVKCNLGIEIKCVSSTQFENKECESLYHERLG